MMLRSGFTALFLIALAWPAAAYDTPHRDRIWHATFTVQNWASTRLPMFPYNLVTGRLRFADSQILTGAVAYVPIRRFDIPLPAGYALRGNSVELEAQLVKHFGLQDHVEGTAAVVLRSGEFDLPGGLSFNVAWGNGLSYAFSDPKFERGPEGIEGVNTRRLQYYMGIEAEFSHVDVPNLHLVTKLHHRSGIYGVISPQRTGSNFIGAGVRWDFR